MIIKYDITRVPETFSNYLIGTFFTLYLVILLALTVACKGKGIIHLVNFGLLILSDIFVMVWQYRYDDSSKHIIRVKKTAGYFLFLASLSIWFTGVGKLINEIFEKDLVPLIKPDL